MPTTHERIERRMREVLQRDILRSLRSGENPFLEYSDASIAPGELTAAFVLLRGGALKYAHYPRPPQDEVEFHNDIYSRVPQTLRLSIYTAETEEARDVVTGARGFRPDDPGVRSQMERAEFLASAALSRRHEKAYDVGVAYLHEALKQIGASFTPTKPAGTHYGLPGDGTVKRHYTREEMRPFFTDFHVADLADQLPAEGMTAQTHLGLMRCIGLVPPDRELGWDMVSEGRFGSKTPVLPQDLRRMLSVTLSLLAVYGQDAQNEERNGDAIAAWLLDTYNASSALGSRLAEPETKEMIAGLSLMTMAALGVSLEEPRSPAGMRMPFFLEAVHHEREADIGWLTQCLNGVADWDHRVSDTATRTLLGMVNNVYQTVFTGFGRTSGNVFNFRADEARVVERPFVKLSGFVPTATELHTGDLKLDLDAFSRAYPTLAAEHPTLGWRATEVLQRDFELASLEKRDRSEDRGGLKEHDQAPPEGFRQMRKNGHNGHNGAGGSAGGGVGGGR